MAVQWLNLELMELPVVCALLGAVQGGRSFSKRERANILRDYLTLEMQRD